MTVKRIKSGVYEVGPLVGMNKHDPGAKVISLQEKLAKNQLETSLDPRTQEIVNAMPEWHQNINRNTLIPLYGQHFEFWGIDPLFPNRIILEWKEPTGRGS